MPHAFEAKVKRRIETVVFHSTGVPLNVEACKVAELSYRIRARHNRRSLQVYSAKVGCDALSNVPGRAPQ
jgi:hypothetical protein